MRVAISAHQWQSVAISGAHGRIALEVVDESRFAEEGIRLDGVDPL